MRRPFRGSLAIAAGPVTAKQLRGPRFRRLFRDTFVDASVEVDDGLMALGAAVALGGTAVLGGWAAAEVLGASCGPEGFAPEVVVPSRRRTRPGMRLRHEMIPASEIIEVDGVRVTDHRRTAFDLGRRPPLLCCSPSSTTGATT